MSLDFDIRTAYGLLGVLSLGGAVGVHASLRERGRPRHRAWVVGAACFGGALTLVALRGVIPELVTFEISHLLFVSAFVLQISAIRAELGQGWRARAMGLIVLGSVLLYTALTTLDRGWGLMYNAVVIMAGSLVIVGSALALWRQALQLPALVIASGFGLLSATLLARILSLLQTSLGSGGPFEPGVTQVVLMMGGLFAIILGNLGYLGLQFLRMAAERVESERTAAMEVERSRQNRERAAALNQLLEERNQLIQRLARSEAASDLALFATTLPHELSQPLCAAKLSLDGLRRALEKVADPSLVAMVRSIETSNDRVLDLLQQLRILLQTQEPTAAEVLDLRALVVRTLPILEGSFRERQILLLSCLPDLPLEVRASAHQLQQLLLILCAHVLDDLRRQPTPPGREAWVRVTLSGDSGQVRLHVEDSGEEGRAPEEQPLVRGAARRGEGVDRLGIGFAIAQRVAQAHHGELSVESGKFGGTAFLLKLPTAEVMREASETKVALAGAQASA